MTWPGCRGLLALKRPCNAALHGPGYSPRRRRVFSPGCLTIQGTSAGQLPSSFGHLWQPRAAPSGMGAALLCTLDGPPGQLVDGWGHLGPSVHVGGWAIQICAIGFQRYQGFTGYQQSREEKGEDGRQGWPTRGMYSSTHWLIVSGAPLYARTGVWSSQWRHLPGRLGSG